MNAVTVGLAELEALMARALVAAGASPENAAQVAAALAAAEAQGLSGHGAARLPAYADQAASGKVDGRAVPVLRQTAAGALMVDAASGFAYPAIAIGLERACELAPAAGVVGVGIANSHHFGAAGLHVERVARRGFIGLGFGNSPAAIAPWGGRRALYGTNPIAFACPRRAAEPLVIDLSLSKVARGEVMVAAQRGEPIPEGWALDKEGRPTTDAQAALAGAMLPIGDAKGAALVLVVELLAAALTGSQFGYEASSFFAADGSPPHVGQFFLVIDPAAFAGADVLARTEALIATIEAQEGARLPGARRLANRATARAEGIALPIHLYDEIKRRAAAAPA